MFTDFNNAGNETLAVISTCLERLLLRMEHTRDPELYGYAGSIREALQKAILANDLGTVIDLHMEASIRMYLAGMIPLEVPSY